MDLSLLETRLASTDNEKKIESLNQLKQDLINSEEIEDVEHLNSLLKLAIKSNNVNVTSSALACLPYYFPLLLLLNNSDSTSSPTTQTLATIKRTLTDLLPFDKLGDPKEKVRDLARESIISASVTVFKLGSTTLGNVPSTTASGKDKEGPWSYLSRLLIESFTSKNTKMREQSLNILLALRDPLQTSPLAPLRPFTPSLLHLLSDSDSTIRSLALSTTITIFSSPSVTTAAKSDLKKEMVKLEVKEKVQETILSSVLGGGGSTAREASSGSEMGSTGIDSTPLVASPPLARSRPPPTTRSTTSTLPSATTSSSSQPETIPSVSTEISAVYIASPKDLSVEFESMKVGFEGKETEFNWILRDKSIARIRGMLKGNATDRDVVEGFLSGIKSVQDGILKTASSLRTTLATSALALITELSTSLGTTFDPFLEAFLSHTLGMAGQTKKLVATASQSAVTTLITNSNYHLKTIQLIWLGMNDKIVLARTFISAHLITLIKVHGTASKHLIESTGGVEVLEQCLKKGLTDANPIVKENTRSAFWLLKELFPKMTEKVLAGLDVTTTKQLEKADPSKKIGATTAATGGSTSNGTGKSGRPSMRDMIALAKAGSKISEDQEVLGGTSSSSNSRLGSLSVSTSAMTSPGIGQRPLVDRTVSAPLPTPTSPKLIPIAPVQIASIPSPQPTNPSSPTPSISASSTISSPPRRSQIPYSPAAPHQTLQGSPSRTMEPNHFSNSHSPSLPQSRLTPSSPPLQSRPIQRVSALSSPTKSISGDAEEGFNEDATTNLMNSPAPFNNDFNSDNGSNEDETYFSPSSPLPSSPPPPAVPSKLQEGSSIPPPPPASSTKRKNSGMILPVTEPIVDAALHNQARQAELTAERLLEIAREDNDESTFSGISTPGRKQQTGNGNGVNPPVGKGVGVKDVFADSPDVTNGRGRLEVAGKNWWMKKAESLFSVFPSISSNLPVDSPERIAIINSKISALRSHQIDSAGIRYLATVSKERPLREDIEEEASVSVAVEMTNKQSQQEEAAVSAKLFWEEERRSVKLFEGLSGFLLDEKVRDRRETALVLLKNLVQHQFPCLSGDEANFFGLLFKLREDPSRSIVAAVESISDVFCNQVEPLYGLGILRTSLSYYLEGSVPYTASTKFSYALGLRMIGGFFERIPVEILEEELPKCRELILKALNDSQSGDLRRASVNSLVSCQSILRDETRLYTILGGGLGKDQLNLLSYYFSKLNLIHSSQSSRGVSRK